MASARTRPSTSGSVTRCPPASSTTQPRPARRRVRPGRAGSLRRSRGTGQPPRPQQRLGGGEHLVDPDREQPGVGRVAVRVAAAGAVPEHHVLRPVRRRPPLASAGIGPNSSTDGVPVRGGQVRRGRCRRRPPGGRRRPARPARAGRSGRPARRPAAARRRTATAVASGRSAALPVTTTWCAGPAQRRPRPRRTGRPASAGCPPPRRGAAPPRRAPAPGPAGPAGPGRRGPRHAVRGQQPAPAGHLVLVVAARPARPPSGSSGCAYAPQPAGSRARAAPVCSAGRGRAG